MKVYLVFWIGDGGDRESYNVYHSKIITGITKKEVIMKYVKSRDLLGDDELTDINYDYYGALLCKDLTI